MTTPFNNNEKNFNELVFENRNKEYGAYAIRNSYNDAMTRSLLIMLGIVSTVVLSGFLFGGNGPNKKIILPPTQLWDTTTFVLDKPADKPKEPEAAKPVEDVKPPKTDDLNVKVVDDKVDDQLKPNETLVMGKGDPKGVTDSAALRPVEPVMPPAPKTTVEGPEEYHFIAEVMPEMKDMNKFINDNLKYPAMAIDAGMVGTVYVSFIVEKDGSVTNVKILRGIGGGCEQEAVRVVKMMPKWSPAMNQNKPVRVLLNLPIKFKLK